MMRVRGILKTIAVFLISFAGFLLLVFIFINLPFSHRFVTQKVNNIFNSSGIPVHLNSMNKVLPWSAYVQGVLIHSSKGDTIVYAGQVKAGFKSFGLLRKKIILHSVDLTDALVNFSRNSRAEQLNIAEAFSHGKEAESENQDTNKSPWEISLEKAEVRNLSFRMTDSVAGIYVSQDISRIKIETRKMSLADKIILVKSLGIYGATGTLTLNQSRAGEESESGSAWIFGLGELEAENINFVYEDPVNKLKLDLLAGEIRIDARNTDINKKIIDIDQFSVSRTDVVLLMDNHDNTADRKETAGPAYFDWDISGKILKLQDVTCRIAKYSDTADYSPLSGFSIFRLGMKLSELQISKSDMTANIEDLKFDLGNGFSMNELNGRIESDSVDTRIDLGIETASSRFNMDVLADGNIFDIIRNPAGVHKANLAIRNTDLSLKDIIYFKPDLEKITGIKSLVTTPVTIDGDLKLDGPIVTVSSFSISQHSQFNLLFRGKIDNIFSPRKTLLDLKADINNINPGWLKELMKEVTPGIQLPDFKTLSLECSVSDSLRSPEFVLKLNSDLGRIALQGSFDYDHDTFSVKPVIDGLKLGKILKSPAFGAFSGSAEINGSGLIGKSLNAEALFLVDSLSLKDYIYKHAEIECKIQPGKYFLKLDLNDPSLALDIEASADNVDSKLSVSVKGKIAANLCNLHLLKDSVIVEGLLSSDLNKYRDEIDAGLFLSEVKIATPRDSVTIHKISASLKSDSLSTNVVSESDFYSASAHMAKSVGMLAEFGQDYLKHLGSIIDPQKADSIKVLSNIPSINGKVRTGFNKAFRIFVPDTTLSFRELSFSFNTNVAENKINYVLRGKGLKYRLAEIEDLNASLADSAAALNLNILADTCLLAGQPIRSINIASQFSDWKSLTSFSVIDNMSRLNYNFEISSLIDSNNIILEFPSQQITLNGVKWHIDSPEFLRINLKTKVFSPSVRLRTDSSFISLVTDKQGGWQNYRLELNNVVLSSFLKSELLPGIPDFLISGFTTFAGSKTNGNKLSADLQFKNISWYDLRYKIITLNSSFLADTSGNYNFEINTSLDTSEIKIRGKRPDKANRNISAHFKLIPVSSIQPFVTKYLSDLGGNISGEFNITTKDEINNFNGDLLINNGKLRITSLNSSYRLPDERIKFTGKRMEFNNFKVLDSLNHELLVDGFVDLSNKNQIFADLGIASTNLQVLNKKADKNATFYGNIFIDSRLSIKGAVTSPVLKGTITLAKGTDIYFRQSENLNLSESGNVLTFVSRKTDAGSTGQKTELRGSLYNKSSVESVVQIDPATRINIDISKKMFNIDLIIQGGGELNYNMLVNSQVNINGKYEISEGGANLKMVGWPNKAFRLTRGGFIRWDGKLDDPDLKLEAINRVKSSYINPVDNKERYVDFDVTLKISNRLSAMDVSFTINTSDQYLMSIINTMSPEEQMRQAITILLFEYIDLPGISTSSNYVSEQVNQMVAAQLNSLTKTTIKGIDISFGIDTYTQGTSTGGQQTKTSLSYEVKKNLLNDRAKVEFSGIVSDATNQSGGSNTSLNNFTFEYRIDSAATKFLKVYNEHSYEDVFEGDVVKTGVGFTYRKNYPSLRDIWRKKEKTSQPIKPDK
jgi:hypothetical protein